MSIDPKELAESLAAVRRGTVRRAAKEAVLAAGAIDPDVVDVFLKSAGDKIGLTEDLDVVGVTESLETFKSKHPALFGAAPAGSKPNQPALDFRDPKVDVEKAVDAYARSLQNSIPMKSKLDFHDPNVDPEALAAEFARSLPGRPE
jgi:hypothetical protein